MKTKSFWNIAMVVAAGLILLASAPTGASTAIDANPDQNLLPYQALSQASPVPFPAVDATCPAWMESSMSTAPGTCAQSAQTTSGASDASTSTSEPVSLTPTTIPGAHGAASMLPLPSAGPGSYLLVHQYGQVSLTAADGSRVWNRSGNSFEDDWGVRMTINPRVQTGFDPFDPFDRVSSGVYALGKLTGSGTDYLAVAHVVRLYPSSEYGTFVTILDAGTGRTAWTQFYPGYVTQLLVEDGMLLVGDETGPPTSGAGEQGTQTVLQGLTFSAGDGGTLVAQQVWSYSTDTEWARWLALEPAGPGKVVAAWTGTQPGSGDSDYGHVVRFDTATGQQSWAITTQTYPRLLRYDTGRDELVWIGQTDPTVEWSYTLAALHSADGTPAGQTITRTSAVPFALEVGDVDGEPGAEWVTTHAAMSSPNPATGSSVSGSDVSAADGDSGSTLWHASASADNAAYPYGLSLQRDGERTVVLAASYFPRTEPTPWLSRWSGNSQLRALAGATGAKLWDRGGNDGSDALSPLALAPYSVGGKASVLTATGANLVVHAYALADGAVLKTTPLLANVTAVETADVNGDGVTDLIVGGQSEAVFALDGTTLGANPKVLWVTPVEGEVHDIHAVTLPDGTRELAVAAATARVADPKLGNAYPTPTRSAVEVLAADTGKVRFRIPTLPDYAWTATVAKLTPDGVPAIVVPTSSLTAYRASDGSPLWRFAPLPVSIPGQTEGGSSSVYFSRPAITPEGKVAVQYWLNRIGTPYTCLPNPTPPPPVVCAGVYPTVTTDNFTDAVLEGATGQPLWQAPHASPGWPDPWGVAVGTRTAADTPGVAFTNYNYVWRTRARQLQINVYDLNTGSLSYTALPASPWRRHTTVLPINGLVAYGFTHITSISPSGDVERKVAGPVWDVDEGHGSRFGDVLAVADFLGSPLYIYDAEPAGAAYTQVARGEASSFNFPFGGRLLIRDLDGDGSDEIVQSTYDWSAFNATQNQYGAFSAGSVDNGPRAIQIYSLASPTPTESPSATFTDDSAPSGQFSDKTFFEARLTDSNGDPIAGQQLTFELAGAESSRSFSATTDKDGVASVTPTLNERPGAHQLTVRYEGDEERSPSADTMAFTVEREDSALELTVHGEDDNKTLRARLSDLDSSEGVADRAIDFYSDGELIGSSQTGAEGVASLPLPPRHRGNNRTYEAVFGGDDFYLGSSDERPGKGGNGSGNEDQGANAPGSRKLLVM